MKVKTYPKSPRPIGETLECKRMILYLSTRVCSLLEMSCKRRLILENLVALQTLQTMSAELGRVLVQGHGWNDGCAGGGRDHRPRYARLDLGHGVRASSPGALQHRQSAIA